MAKNRRREAYVVFRGRKPGVYHTWEDVQEQTEGFSKNKQYGYDTVYEAELAWADWQQKVEVKAGASTFLQQAAAKSKHKPACAPSWSDLPNGRFDQGQPPNFPPLAVQTATNQEASSPISKYAQSTGQPPMQNTPPDSSPPDFVQALKRDAAQMDDMNGEWGIPSRAKKSKFETDYEVPPPVLSREERYELDQLEKQKQPSRAHVDGPTVVLTPEQDKVVNLALGKNNIFLTGAAGSGKTVTLKEILRRIRKRKTGGKVEVVAPTGIAALPLEGRTTYSFAGWHMDSFRDSIVELLKKPKIRVIKAINELDVLVVEEISMVENLFLERLNLLFQKVLDNQLPFGGKQVIFLGDFYQLPPVKPFTNCMYCGQDIPPPPKATPKCSSPNCTGVEYAWGDKWAFRSAVWKELNLRHIKLEQIHRQKDTDFQDILNKIRNGVILSADEWKHLERPKDLPEHAYAVRLMSRLAQVKSFNEQKLAELKSQPKSWRANDSAVRLIESLQGKRLPVDEYKVKEYKDTLRDHRFPSDLTLKVGSRVVLLYNLSHEDGLVNGSQGVVIGFAPSSNELEKIRDREGPHQAKDLASMEQFQALNPEKMRPLVRFVNGKKALITAIPQSSTRGDVLDKMQQYVVTRTQIPLTLAWALSIHKSQGMTLEYVEVLSRDIFETGQLYVALSRATHLNGLRVTGFKREQLPMDQDVLKFYKETKWEVLERPTRKKKATEVIDLT